MKAKCIVNYDADLTYEKVYDVIRIDEDGDVWIIDDSGDEYFMYPSECEVFE